MKQQWIEQIKKKASLLEIDEKPAELLITEQQAKQLYQYMEPVSYTHLTLPTIA